MHPEIVKDAAGTCDICGMPLVRVESLGYVGIDPDKAERPLVIPATAPLITGKRAVVYVAIPKREGHYEGREIVLGERAGDYYIVREGLSEGEMVVVNGNFKIDSALQILAKPSMMSPEGGAPPPGHQHAAPSGETAKPVMPEAFQVPDAFKQQLGAVLSAYFKVQQGLSRDELDAAKSEAAGVLKALDATDMALLEGPAHMAWMKELDGLKKSAGDLAEATDIQGARVAFALLSESLAAVATSFGTPGEEPVLRFHCPMAFNNRGADWLQNKAEAENPYFGQTMLRCGEQTQVISPGPAHKEAEGGPGHD